MLKLNTIKTTDLVDATGMSLRSIRYYQSGEIEFKFIKGENKLKQARELLTDAKAGLLIVTLSDPTIDKELFKRYKCDKKDDTTPIDELRRLAKIGKLIGSWYFSDEFKKEMVK